MRPSFDFVLKKPIGGYENSDSIRRIHTEYVTSRYPRHDKLYTDGCKCEQGCGVSFYEPRGKTSFKFRIHKLSSSFSAELFAILCALKWKQTQVQNKFLVMSDCLSALQAIDGSKRYNNLLIDILLLLSQLHQRGVETVFMWIHEHAHISGNDVADKLPKNAAVDENGTEQHSSLSLQEARSYITSLCQEEWQREFHNVN